MILTVTANTALDHVFFLPRLRPGARNQATRSLRAMGGKGCVVAEALVELGEDAVAIGLAGGEAGRRMEEQLRARGVVTDFTGVAGETRVNAIVIESETRVHTTLCEPGLRPTEADLDALVASIRAHGPSARAIVLAGSLPETWPPGHYAVLAAAARACGAPVVIDASGPGLLAALDGGVAAAKPNASELAATLGGPRDTLAAIVAGARALVERGAGWALISRGAAGAAAVSADEAWTCGAPAVEARNPAGAGDGMTACVARGLARGDSLAETLRWAVAVGSAIASTDGTGEFSRAHAEALLAQIEPTRWEG